MSRDPDSATSSSSDEGSDVDELDTDFLQTLAKLKQRDPAIYDSSHRLFDADGKTADDSEPSGGADEAQLQGTSQSDRKSKPKFLRQVLAEQALEGGPESDDEGTGKRSLRPKTYHEEQSAVKDAFLQAADSAGNVVDEGEFGNVLSKQPSTTEGPAAPASQADHAVVKELMVQCFGKEGQSEDPSDAFLRDYMQRQAWRGDGDGDGDDGPISTEPAATNDLDEDLEHTEQAERFEAKFNFRFEEPGSSHTITYPREMEGTIRKKDERRKLARQRKALRQEEEERRQAEEAKRLRKADRRAKRAEQQALAERDLGSAATPADQVAALREAGGAGGPDEQRLLAMMTDEEFDPAAYDAAMASAFDGDYYKVDEEFAREDNKEEWPAQGSQEGGDDEDNDADQGGVAAAEQAEASSDSEAEGDGMLPGVREGAFRYRKVPKADYGLSVEEMLTMDPKELNQVISVKRLAPYRNDRYTARPNWQKMQELRDEKATAVAARKPCSSKTKHKMRSHEKAALYAQEAAQGGTRLPHTAAAKAGSKAGSKQSAAKQRGSRKPGSNSSTQTATQERDSKPNGSRSSASGAVPGPNTSKDAAEADKGNGVASSNTAAKDAAKKARDQERRLQSYGKLTLRKDGPSASSKKRSAAQAEMTIPEDAGSGLGKQVKKRLKRTAKRAAARAAADQS